MRLELLVNVPASLTVVDIARRPVVIQVENSPAGSPDPVICLAYSPGAPPFSRRGMFWAHVSRHTASARIIVPLADQFNNCERSLMPDKPTGTVGNFF